MMHKRQSSKKSGQTRQTKERTNNCKPGEKENRQGKKKDGQTKKTNERKDK